MDIDEEPLYAGLPGPLHSGFFSFDRLLFYNEIISF